MRSWVRRGLVVLVAAGLFAFFFVPVRPAVSTTGSLYFSLIAGGGTEPGTFGLSDAGIPPNCSGWHELWPNFCTVQHQDAYQDMNTNNCVDPGDKITLNGEMYTVTWVGPTYYLTCFPEVGDPAQVIWEPNQGPHDPANPVCETWEEVSPNFGDLHHIDSYSGSGPLIPCGEFFASPAGGGPQSRYHVDNIALNIIIEIPVATEQTTWGMLKNRFQGN